MSRYETAIVTPLAINDEAELALRRVAPRVPTGKSIGGLIVFRYLMAVELPAVNVDRLTGPFSPAWGELPLDALGPMTSRTPDEGLDVDALVATEPGESRSSCQAPPWSGSPTTATAIMLGRQDPAPSANEPSAHGRGA